MALHNFRSKDEQQAVIDSWTKSYKTFVGNINNASADQVNDLVSSFIADSVTFGITHKTYQATSGIKSTTGKTLQTQKPFSKKLNETSSMQIRNQLPATTRSNQKPRSITPTKIAANSVAKKTSQTKSSKSSSSTDTQIQKAAQNKTTVAEQKSFKPAVEESAKKTGQVQKTSASKDGYFEVNGFKFTEYYYNRLWVTGRKAPSLIAKSILDHATTIIPDPRGHAGFYKYVADKWYMIYNPTTKIISHLEPIR